MCCVSKHFKHLLSHPAPDPLLWRRIIVSGPPRDETHMLQLALAAAADQRKMHTCAGIPRFPRHSLVRAEHLALCTSGCVLRIGCHI